jgi:hypothetical protein
VSVLQEESFDKVVHRGHVNLVQFLREMLDQATTFEAVYRPLPPQSAEGDEQPL